MGKKRSKSERRAKQREAKGITRLALGDGPGGVVLVTLEFATTFRLAGGMANIGRDFPARIRVFDAQGRRMRKEEFGISDRLLGIGRDEASEFMARARDAEAWRIIREAARNVTTQRRTSALLAADLRGSMGWCRDRDVPDQQLRHVLSGTNGGMDPTRESRGQVVCFREGSKDGRAVSTRETWTDGWTEENGERSRVNVSLSPPMEWADIAMARSAAMMLVRLGEVEDMPSEFVTDEEYLLRYRADKLLRWERVIGGVAHAEVEDKKAKLERFRKSQDDEPKLPKGQRWEHKPAYLAKRNVDPKDLAALQSQ